MATATRARMLSSRFSPTQLTDLAVWLDAGQLTGLTDGTAVTSWTDVSGNGRHATQANGTKKPLYKTGILNGWPVLRFDGGDDHLETPSFTALTQPNTVVVVAKATALFFERALFDGLVPTDRHYLELAPTQWGIFAGAGPIYGGTSDNAWHVFTAIYNGASSLLRVDGTQVLTGNAGAHSVTGLVLGIAIDRTSSPFNGDMAEVLLYHQGLDATERQLLERALGAKYGIGVA